MAEYRRPRGTEDLLPRDINKWQTVEKSLLDVAHCFGFKEIRTPTFEHTELFLRGVGDTTDVVQKEMYTFEDKGNRSITLRPEGTAGVVRAAMENGLLGDALPLKLCYFTNCFRYEKPQAGRLREFRQFGVEVFGPSDALADAEVISLAYELFDRLGIKGLTLELNSIGCPECRAKYHEALRSYFSDNVDSLCQTCHGRLERNPMRILDCKSAECSVIAAGAPTMLKYLCKDCTTHFETVRSRLDTMGIAYKVNPQIVRGLDYYTRTVFEFVSTQIGTQGTVCGGGRYDGLVGALGGKPVPGLGFAIGLNRLIMVMEAQGIEFPAPKQCDLFISVMGDKASETATALVYKLRSEGFWAECDLMGRSLKAQMKYSDKIGAKFTMVLGDNELSSGNAKLKNMASGENTDIALGDNFSENLYDVILRADLENVVTAAKNFGENNHK